MTHTISRMYASKAQATKAFEHLKKLNYINVHMFAAPSANEDGTSAPGSSVAEIAAQMMKAHILKHQAHEYAERVSKGASLVTVHALFGTALDARTALDSHGPVESGVPEPDYTGYIWDEKTPISSALRLRVLAEQKLPFEKMWGVPSVTKGVVHYSSLLGLPMLSKPGTPLSSALGRNTLSSNKTPFSSRLGLPLLK